MLRGEETGTGCSLDMLEVFPSSFGFCILCNNCNVDGWPELIYETADLDEKRGTFRAVQLSVEIQDSDRSQGAFRDLSKHSSPAGLCRSQC